MVGAFRFDVGGICGLLTLPVEQWGAVEADLLERGFVLADVPGKVSWRAVKSLVRHATRDSAFYRATVGAASLWGPGEYLLAVLVDLAQMELWAKTRDGHRNLHRPAPIRRPGEDVPDEEVMGDASESIEEIDEWLRERWNRQHQIEAATTVEAVT